MGIIVIKQEKEKKLFLNTVSGVEREIKKKKNILSGGGGERKRIYCVWGGGEIIWMSYINVTTKSK